MMGAYYARLLRDDDGSLVTAKIWDQWEDSIAKLIPDPVLIARTEEDPRFARTLARIEAHYFVNLGFMPDGFLVAEEQISKVRHIPVIVVQGRYDIVCPVGCVVFLWARVWLTPRPGGQRVRPQEGLGRQPANVYRR